MRLIDADELKMRMFQPPEFTVCPPDIAWDSVAVEAYKIGWNDAVKAISEIAPTIDPVRRGRWELEEEQKHVELIYSCSECGCIAWGNEEISNYCPNCGARMEESGDNE